MARGVKGKSILPSAPIPLLALLLLAVVTLLYVNTLSHGFVFDDTPLIQQNPDVTELNWGRILGRTGYRPVRTLTYALNYALGGLDPFGYHLTNILLHAANSILTLLLLLSILGKTDASFLGALLFAVHPVQTASVAYVSGRKDLLAALFLLVACLLYRRWRRQPGWPTLLLTGLALVAAVLSKEVAVVFPALFVLLDLCSPQNPQAGAARRTDGRPERPVLLYLGLAALGGVAICYAVVWTEASRAVGHWGGSLLTQWATSFKLFVHYLRLALAPYPLLADYTGSFQVSTGFGEPATLFSVLVCAVYAGLAIRAFRSHPPVALGMGWFLVCLLPVLQIVGFHEIAADHFLYLPMFGVALVFGTVAVRAVAARSTNVLAWAFLLAVFLFSALLTVSRNRVWADELTLWEATRASAPRSYRANANLGQLYFARFDSAPNPDPSLRQRAIRLSEQATRLDPEDSLAPSNLGSIYRKWGLEEYGKGNTDRAEELEQKALGYLSTAVSLDPEDVWALSNLADVHKDLGLIQERRDHPAEAARERQRAVELYERAIAIGSPHPQFPWVYFNLAMVRIDQGRFQEALHWLKRAAGTPGIANEWEFAYWMGHGYLVIEGNVSAAIPLLRTAVRIRPTYPPGLRLLGYALAGTGKLDEAVDLYRRALEKDPESYETHYLMGLALKDLGRSELALEHAEQARQLVEAQPLSSTVHWRREIETLLKGLRNKGE